MCDLFCHDQLVSCGHLKAEDLENLSANPFDLDSTSNQFGRYGSPFSPDSLNNQFGAGNPFRSDSPNNPYGKRGGGLKGVNEVMSRKPGRDPDKAGSVVWTSGCSWRPKRG